MQKVLISSPIKSMEGIHLIKYLLKKKIQTHDLLISALLINTGVDLVDLLKLTIEKVKNKFYLTLDKLRAVALSVEENMKFRKGVCL